MKNKKKRTGLKAIALLAVVVVIAVVAMQMLGGSTVSAFAEETAKTGSITTYYSFSGNVVIKDSQSITAQAAATVRELYVAQGDTVAKDDRLLRLSTGDTIKAGVAGEINNLPVEKDDEVMIGDLLLEIVNFDDLEIQIKVDEFDVKAISIGKSAQVTLNSLNQTFESMVIDFDKQATQSGDISYYTATLAMNDMPDVLPGMQVDVKIQNAHVENATLIPMSALQFDDYNQPYVMIRDGTGNARKASVRVGANDGVMVEIMEGLRSGETVQMPKTVATASTMMMPGGGRTEGINGN